MVFSLYIFSRVQVINNKSCSMIVRMRVVNMTFVFTRVVEKLVTSSDNSASLDYPHPHDQTPRSNVTPDSKY